MKSIAAHSHKNLFALVVFFVGTSTYATEPIVVDLWSGKPPGEKTTTLPAEADRTTSDDKLIAGRRVIRLGNVSVPQVAVYQPASHLNTGAAVLVCPGGGHHILAYDLEGTEVAEWLNSIGVTGVVLKYRVPFRDPDQRWRAAVQDAQRAMSLVRSRAAEWEIDPERIGICGFSAGGETAGLTSLLSDRQYDSVDAIDTHPFRPDFAILVYPGGFAAQDGQALRDHVRIPQHVPPMFFVHAFDDRVTVQHSLLLASAVKAAGGSAELHVFAKGGHGYGLRKTPDAVTRWPVRAGAWMRELGLLKRPE